MHIISALDLGIMEINLSEVMLLFGVWCSVALDIACLGEKVGSSGGHCMSVPWCPPTITGHSLADKCQHPGPAPHPALAPSIDLSGVWV